MASQSVIFPSQVLAEKGKFRNPTLSDITCSRIKAMHLTKIADLGIIFLRKKIPHPVIPVIIYIYYRSMPLFFWGPPCIGFTQLKNLKPDYYNDFCFS